MMDDFQSETDSDYTSYWRDWFISSRGNEYFCEIDEEYLTDRFNLTGLNTEVHYYQHALDLITDVFDLDCDDEMREQIEKSARHLYGMVHARYIVTTRGLAKMVEKYKKSDFGRCPRVYCEGHSLLPTGLSDVPNNKSIKLYCARCEDLYNPKSSRHASIDGAYFSTSFATTLFQVYPALVPAKSLKRYEPKIFGFKVHSYAALARYQDQERRMQRRRLQEAGAIPVLPASTAATNAQGEAVDVSGVAGSGIGTRQQIFVEDAEDTDGMRTFEDEERELERESTQAQLTGAAGAAGAAGGGRGGGGGAAAQNLGALRAAALQRHIQAAQAAQAEQGGDEAMEG